MRVMPPRLRVQKYARWVFGKILVADEDVDNLDAASGTG